MRRGINLNYGADKKLAVALHLACVQSKFNVALVQIEKALGELYSSFSDNIKRYKTGSH